MVTVCVSLRVCAPQSFCQYRGKLSSKTPEELAVLKSCEAWNLVDVFNILQVRNDTH